jgi:hypothetical protein
VIFEFVLRLSLVFAMLSVFLPFSESAFAGPEPTPTVNIRLYNYAHVSPPILIAAEREADKILGAADVHPVWADCLEKETSVERNELCDRGWGADTPSVRLLSGHVTKQFQDFEFGFAAIPVLATVSYDHVARRAFRDDIASELPTILGCVIAHELGHLLLRDPNHSATGIMQAAWGHDQIRHALTGRLRFTAQQSNLIRERALTLTRLLAENIPSPVQ